jgi:hypothetical protein
MTYTMMSLLSNKFNCSDFHPLTKPMGEWFSIEVFVVAAVHQFT